MQLLHWIWVYCGCVSIIPCKTSQSKIYLTAKTAGETEEDMGVLSFLKWWMDSCRPFVCFCVRSEAAGRPGQLMEISNPSLHDIASFPLRTLQDWCGLNSIVIRGDSGVPYTFKGILVIYIAFNVLLCPTRKPLKISYTVVWFHLKTVPHKMYWEIFSSAF